MVKKKVARRVVKVQVEVNEKPIVRQSAVAWWCPICNFSMEIRLQKCAKCGAIRKGNVVRR